MTTDDRPTLLKSRQFHSRIFAVVAIFLLATTAPELPQDSLVRALMLWAGYALIIFGAFGRVYCSAFIGGRKNKTVIRSGPFSVVRNPLYVFSFFATIGIGLQSGMWVVTGLLVAAFVIYYPFVVAREEKFLRHKFDESYEAYLREVPRWMPNMKLWQEPVEAHSKPLYIRRTITDAVTFFIPMPVFALIGALQAHSILPIWLTLP